eukprot:712445-Prymnesium_polylepis.1
MPRTRCRAVPRSGAQVIEHVSQPWPFVQKLLRTGAVVVLSVPYRWQPCEHVRCHHKQNAITREMITIWAGRRETPPHTAPRSATAAVRAAPRPRPSHQTARQPANPHPTASPRHHRSGRRRAAPARRERRVRPSLAEPDAYDVVREPSGEERIICVYRTPAGDAAARAPRASRKARLRAKRTARRPPCAARRVLRLQCSAAAVQCCGAACCRRAVRCAAAM